MQKVAVFLDFANLNQTARDLSVKIDYKHLLGEYLSSNDEGRFLQSAFAYVPIDPRSGHSLDADINTLWAAGFIVHTKLGIIAGHSFKCNFDVEIAMDIMRIALSVKPDIITIISGDSDFIPLALELRALGIYVEAAAFMSSMSKQFIQKVSGYICLDQYYKEFLSQRRMDAHSQFEIGADEDAIDFTIDAIHDDMEGESESADEEGQDTVVPEKDPEEDKE